MRRALIVIAVLGSGTALSFLAAGMIFLAAPDGHLVANNGNGSVGLDPSGPIVIRVPGKDIQVPMPVTMPVDQGIVVDPGNAVDDTGRVIGGPLVSTVNMSVGVGAPPQSGTQP
jgi:hypothetical protein